MSKQMKKAERAIGKALEAANAPSMKGIRNKGKVAAGRQHPKAKAQKQPSSTKRIETNAMEVRAGALPAAKSVIMRRTQGAQRQMTTGLCHTLIAELGTNATGLVFAQLFSEPINPGNTRLFPRVARIADINERWYPRVMRVKYRPTCPTTTGGFVAIYLDPDPLDVADTNMESVMENKYSVGFTPYSSASLNLIGPEMRRWYFTAGGNLASNATDRQNFYGNLRVVCERVAANTTLGVLEIEYDMVFADQKPPQASSSNIPYLDFSSVLVVDASFHSNLMPITRVGNPAYGWSTDLHMHGMNLQATSAGGTLTDTSLPNGGFTINDGGGNRYVVNLKCEVVNPGYAGTNMSLALNRHYGPGVNDKTVVFSGDVSTSGTKVFNGEFVSFPADSNNRFHAFFTLSFDYNLTGGGDNFSILSPTLTVARANNVNGYGLSNSHLVENKSVDPRSACFQLPTDHAAAVEFLSGIGLCSISYLPEAPELVPDDPLLRRMHDFIKQASKIVAEPESPVVLTVPAPRRK